MVSNIHSVGRRLLQLRQPGQPRTPRWTAGAAHGHNRQHPQQVPSTDPQQ